MELRRRKLFSSFRLLLREKSTVCIPDPCLYLKGLFSDFENPGSSRKGRTVFFMLLLDRAHKFFKLVKGSAEVSVWGLFKHAEVLKEGMF